MPIQHKARLQIAVRHKAVPFYGAARGATVDLPTLALSKVLNAYERWFIQINPLRLRKNKECGAVTAVGGMAQIFTNAILRSQNCFRD